MRKIFISSDHAGYQLKEQIKKQFQKYLSPDMVEELQKDPSKLKLGGDRREMSFMFMDIIGFTPISEHYMHQDDPEGLVELINKNIPSDLLNSLLIIFLIAGSSARIFHLAM